MSNSTSLPQWDPAWVFPLQITLIEAAVTCLGYGCVLILAIVSLRVLIRRGLSSPGQRYLLAAVILFLVSSTIFCAAMVAYSMAALAVGPHNDNQGAIKLDERIYTVIVVSAHLIYLLNDGLVVWRAWVLADQRILHGVLGFSMLITMGLSLLPSSQTLIFTGCTIAESTLNIQAGVFQPVSFTTSLLLYVPLVFNNLLATSVVLHKTWIYQTEVKADLQQSSRKSQVERVLFLLIESGFIYCGFWVLVLITQYNQSVPPMLNSVIEGISPFAAAIYPLLIILVVEHQKSQAEQASARSFSHSLQFNSPPVQSDGQTHSMGTRSVSIIESIVDIQSAQRRSSHGAVRRSRSLVWSTSSNSIIQTTVNLQSAKKEGVKGENGMPGAPHNKDLESAV